jgi:spore maturation protein CgeB
MVSDPTAMEAYDLRHYDGVLAFGQILRDLYLAHGHTARAWTWHEAADTTVFLPPELDGPRSGLVWIGNWGDGERSAELREFLLEPARDLNLQATAYGVRFPPEGRAALAEAGMQVRGWLPNYRVPEVFARHTVTVHVPRRPYVRDLPGIPTIRVFEALACGIPLVCAPWDDREEPRCAPTCEPFWRNPTGQPPWPNMASLRSVPAIPAPTGWTSCSPSTTN